MPRGAVALLVVVVLVCGLAAQAAFINSFAGPYLAYTKHFFTCGEGCEEAADYKIRVTHFNPARPTELQHLTGYFDLRADFNDSQWIKVILDTRSNNQWKENAFVFSMPHACSSSRMHIPDVFRVFFEGTSLDRGECSVPARNYSFMDEPIKWVFPHFPIMPYGEYRFRLMSGPLAGRSLVCVCAEVVAMPKV